MRSEFRSTGRYGYRGKITNLIAPGSTVTSAAAMFLDALKVLLSTILTVPPGFCIAGTSENLNEYGTGELFGITMSSLTLSGGGIANKNSCVRKTVSFQQRIRDTNKGRCTTHVVEFDQTPANHQVGQSFLL